MVSTHQVPARSFPKITRWTKVPGNSQLYSELQTIYALQVKKNHINKVYNHKDELGKTRFSIEAYKQITIARCNE